MSEERGHTTATGRLITAMAWAVLLLGLWLWGRDVTGLPDNPAGTAHGDVAGLGGITLPAPATPLPESAPQRVDIPQLAIQAPVTSRGLDSRGGIDPPPFDQPGVVGWYGAGTAPGAAGTALLVGHVDTETRPAVFYRLSTLEPGETVRVVRADGEIARFTIDDVEVLPADHFDAARAYGTRHPGRAELRLITCGGTYDRASRTYTANVVVSAYLTGTGS
ncbi:class F sortase [Streptomyces sp. NPDC017615]|uniref:class F sortase n=1 Tax=Streptomyces sp. NPDC017615 TaxID=3365003 RepID=UPI0037B0C63E